MEISAVSCSKVVPSPLYAPFADQSHLQFYGRGRNSFLPPSSLRFKFPSCRSTASRSVLVPVQAFSSAVAPEFASEEALMKELADLKLRMKQKKKELKAHMKEDKKKMKEEKKRNKQKKGLDGKLKMECHSESSSSESCDEGCASVSMKLVRQSQAILENARGNSNGGPLLDSCAASCSAALESSVDVLDMDKNLLDSVECQPSSPLLSTAATEASARKSVTGLTVTESSELFLNVASMGEANDLSKIGVVMSPCKIKTDDGLRAFARAFPPLHTANRIEVCTGGKCKKAGSQQLLSTLQGQIPHLANVAAVPCKCMGKCAMAVNVRVLKEDTNPQHHSHVGVEDGPLILNHHFGLGCPPAGLPLLSPKDGIRKPLPLVTT